MIVVCEPQCKDVSHEKINSGFIYGLRLAFPQVPIRFYADATHIEAIKDIFLYDNTVIENIEYVPIVFNGSLSILGMLSFRALFIKIFAATLEVGSNKIFFLSFSPTILYVIKKLKHKTSFQNMKFTFVLHGDFENIADVRDRPIVSAATGRPLINRLLKTKLSEYPRKIAGVIIRLFHKFITETWQSAFIKLFPTKQMILWKHSSDIKYVALSPHILVNAKKYLDVEKLNMYPVVMPMIFAQPNAQPNNQYPKFAVFGYGNSSMLQKVLTQLSHKGIEKPYEIRIIGMDNRGTEGFPNITCPRPGKLLSRTEMEKYAQDIDMFLILYEENRYRLSCSASILESISNTKPILHFNNDCLNTFNTKESPIGYCCDTIDEYANIMEDIIGNYQEYLPVLQAFRTNILSKRKQLSVEASAFQLKDSFTWT